MNQLKYWRTKRKITQEKLVKAIQDILELEYFDKEVTCSYRYYQMLESEKDRNIPNIYLGLAIAKALNVEPFELWK